jgi:hypothetical protein
LLQYHMKYRYILGYFQWLTLKNHQLDNTHSHLLQPSTIGKSPDIVYSCLVLYERTSVHSAENKNNSERMFFFSEANSMTFSNFDIQHQNINYAFKHTKSFCIGKMHFFYHNTAHEYITKVCGSFMI